MLAALIIILVICIIILIIWNVFFKSVRKFNKDLMKNSCNVNSGCPCDELSAYLQERNDLNNHYIVILYSGSNSSNLHSLKEKMYMNNKNISNCFAKMYGPDNGHKLNALLDEECNANCAFLNNAKNKLPCERLVSEWYQSGNKTCDFLCSVNPRLNDNDLIILIKDHKDSLVYHAQSLSSGEAVNVSSNLMNNTSVSSKNLSNYLSQGFLADKANWVVS